MPNGMNRSAPVCLFARKYAWSSARLARKHLRRRARRGYIGDVYACAECGCWHIGSNGAMRALRAAREGRTNEQHA